MNPRVALFSQKLFPKSNGKIDTMDAKSQRTKNLDVLRDCHNAWNSLDTFRSNARRNEKYIFGEQWDDKILVDGKYITEKQHIINQGNIPMQNNRIRGTIRTIISLYSSNKTEPVCVVRDRDEQALGDTMSAALQYVSQINKISDVDQLNLMYQLGSGVAAYYSQYGKVGDSGRRDISIRSVNYNNIFFDNHMQDVRHWDCHLIGELHDLGLYDVMAMFSTNRQEAEEIRKLYRSVNDQNSVNVLETITDDKTYNKSFFTPSDDTRCRVIEVWKLEAKERIRVHDRLTGDLYKVEIEQEKSLIAENKKRKEEQLLAGVLPENLKLIEYEWFIDNFWYFWYMTPLGDVLKEGETPYSHKSHPYSFKISPFYNGRVRPFVSDYVDQQRMLNRYIITQDFITRHAAKGVLMFPEEAKPDDMSMEEISTAWTKYNGIIYYKAKPGIAAPQQIISNSSNAGLYDMINLQLKMFEDISGVQGAIQGQAPKSGTPASLFAQQVQNSATALTEVFDSFKGLREDLFSKVMKLIQQFYDHPKYINLVGQDARSVFYDPKKIQYAEIDLSLTDSPTTPAYRMVINEMLMNLQATGQITLEEMLQAGSFPYGDKLLQLVSKRQQQGAPINADQLMEEAQR
jgi:hypothetical protein